MDSLDHDPKCCAHIIVSQLSGLVNHMCSISAVTSPTSKKWTGMIGFSSPCSCCSTNVSMFCKKKCIMDLSDPAARLKLDRMNETEEEL